MDGSDHLGPGPRREILGLRVRDSSGSRLSIRRQLFTSFLLIATIAAGFLGVVGTYLFYSVAASSRQARVGENAAAVAQIIESDLGEKRRLVVDLAALAGTWLTDEKGAAARLRELHREETELVSLAILDSSGAALVATRRAPDGRVESVVNVASEEYFGEIPWRPEDRSRFAISEAFADGPGGVARVVLTAPWTNGATGRAGLVLADLDLTSLARRTLALSRLPESEVWVVDSGGRLLWSGPGRTDPSLMQVVLSNAGAGLPDEPERALFAGRAGIAPSGWSVTVQQPRAVLVRGLTAQLWASLAWTAVAVLLSAALATWLARRVASPLERLARQLETVDVGTSTTKGVSAPHGSPYEFDVVVNSVNDLLGRLGGANAGLSRLLAEREATIQRRTAQLRSSEQRARMLVDESLAFVGTHLLDGRILSVNPAASAALGFPADQLVGRRIGELVPERFRGEVGSYLEAIGAEGARDGLITVSTATAERRVWRYHNRLVEMSGEPVVIGIAVDVTEQQRAEAELARQADRDPLTGLPNRRVLSRRLEEAMRRAGRDDGQFALLYLDLDDFKPINDRLGHEAGDFVLREVARRLLLRVRGADTVVRVGGDEFAVVLHEVEGRKQAREVAAILARTIAAPMSWQKEWLVVGASVGVAVYPGDAGDASGLERHADRSMYEAKAVGRSR